jgi:hypothetical protein
LIVTAGSITSSIKYNNLNDGNAIVTKISAGVIVHMISNKLPWMKYLCDIITLALSNRLKMLTSIQITAAIIKER